MKPLRPGKKKWRKALVIGKHDQRSYTMETSDGGTYRRNRMHLRKAQEPLPIIQQDQGSPPTSIPTSHEPADSLETPTASSPPLKPPDKASERKPLEVNEDPPPANSKAFTYSKATRTFERLCLLLNNACCQAYI